MLEVMSVHASAGAYKDGCTAKSLHKPLCKNSFLNSSNSEIQFKCLFFVQIGYEAKLLVVMLLYKIVK